MNIKILGVGCPKCRALEAKVREILSANGLTADIEKVTDINEMTKYNIMMTPALVINEKVKSSGTIPPSSQILTWIMNEME